LSLTLLGACATTASVPDKQVARLPADERAEIVTAQQSINLARQNVTATKVARDDARQFRKIAQNEVAAARSRLEAARTAIDLSRTSRDAAALRAAQRREDGARSELLVARAKAAYADRLIELRQASIDEADANLTAARADVELRKAQLLVRDGIDPGVDVRKLELAQKVAQERLAERRERVAQLQGNTALLKTEWDDRRREAHTASLGETHELRPPVSPVPLTMPRGEVDDTPVVPEAQEQGQEPRSSEIAPAP
jgi:hypothetical protein